MLVCKISLCYFIEDSDDDEPIDLEINGRVRRTRRTTEDDLQNILNLYNVQDTPTVTPQQQRRVTFSADNQGTVTNDVGNEAKSTHKKCEKIKKKKKQTNIKK